MNALFEKMSLYTTAVFNIILNVFNTLCKYLERKNILFHSYSKTNINVTHFNGANNGE